jgi:hypothetical protein
MAGLLYLGYLWLNFGLFREAFYLQLAQASVTHWSIPSYLPFLPYDVLNNTVVTLFPVWLLGLLAFPVVVSEAACLVTRPREYLSRLNPVDSVCLATLAATLLGGLAYDYGDRRMFPLLVPLAVYAGRGLAARWQIAGLERRLDWNRWLLFLGLGAFFWLGLSWWKDVFTNPWPDGSAGWWMAWALAVLLTALATAGLYAAYARLARRDARLIIMALALAELTILSQLALSRLAAEQFGIPAPWLAAGLVAALIAGAVAAAYSRPEAVRLRQWLGWAVTGGYVIFSVGVIAYQLLQPAFTMRDTSRAIGRIAGRDAVILSDVPYDICTETQARCVLWDDASISALGVINANAPFLPGRKFWLQEQDAGTPEPARPNCLTDAYGKVVGSLERLAEFRVSRASRARRFILYALGEPGRAGSVCTNN